MTNRISKQTKQTFIEEYKKELNNARYNHYANGGRIKG
jgi:hypothetical protein